MKTTVIIPNYNGIEYLKNCIESLRESDSSGDFCILVVDNGSTDGSTQWLKEQKDIDTILLDHNIGFAPAVNLAVEKAGTEYILLLNNDTVVRKDFVGKLTESIESDDRIFSVSAKMLSMSNEEIIDGIGDYYCALGWAYAGAKGKKSKITGLTKRNIFSACGGAAIYRRQVFCDLGMLDDAHFAYLEDVDIGYRARLGGYKNIYQPQALCLHAGSGASGSRYNSFKVSLSGRNSIYIIWKNMPLLQILLNLPFFIIGFLVKWLFFLMKGFGWEYIRAICEGFRLCRKNRAKRLSFSPEMLPEIVEIQLELWINIVRRLYFF